MHNYHFFLLLVLSLLFSSCGSTNQLSSARIDQIRVAQDGTRLIKVWGVAPNADAAISKALRNAVEGCLFFGIDAGSTTGRIPPLCPDGVQAYYNNRQYFDRFFAAGNHLQYVNRVNSLYPTGEDNIRVRGGRSVGIQVQLKVNQLRQRMENDGIIKSLDNIWDTAN